MSVRILMPRETSVQYILTGCLLNMIKVHVLCTDHNLLNGSVHHFAVCNYRQCM